MQYPQDLCSWQMKIALKPVATTPEAGNDGGPVPGGRGDQAHHAAPTSRRLLGHFDVAMSLGVTATPSAPTGGSPTSMTRLDTAAARVYP